MAVSYRRARVAVGVLLTVFVAGWAGTYLLDLRGAGAQETSGTAWATGDELRRELQDIGIVFRLETFEIGRSVWFWEWYGSYDRSEFIPPLVIEGRGDMPASGRIRVNVAPPERFEAESDRAAQYVFEVLPRLGVSSEVVHSAMEFIYGHSEGCTSFRVPGGHVVAVFSTGPYASVEFVPEWKGPIYLCPDIPTSSLAPVAS